MILHLSLPGAPSVIAKLLHEDDMYMYVEYPVLFIKEETVVYTMPLMPFADKGKVQLSKNNIIAISQTYKEIEKHYNEVVKYIKKQKVSFKQKSDKNLDKNDLEAFLDKLSAKTYH